MVRSGVAMSEYTPAGLNMVTVLAPQIRAASEYYGVSPLAIAGSIAQEQLNQTEHWDRAAMSSVGAHFYLDRMYASALGYGLLSDPLHANTAARRAAPNV